MGWVLQTLIWVVPHYTIMKLAHTVARRLGVMMPVNTTTIEARRIINRKADAITRLYPGGCPFQVGDKTALYTEVDGAQKEYAFVTVKSLRPCSLAERRKDEGMAEAEGFSHPTSWETNLRSLYGGALDANPSKRKLMRVRFQVDKMMPELEKEQAAAQAKPREAPLDIV